MVAVYDGSRDQPAYYKRHFDCKDPKSNPRRLTAIVYLQDDGWDAERDGGSLRAYLPSRAARGAGGGGGAAAEDVAPLGGRLCLFRSCEVEHEVLPCTASRMAVTLWVSGGDPPDGFWEL